VSRAPLFPLWCDGYSFSLRSLSLLPSLSPSLTPSFPPSCLPFLYSSFHQISLFPLFLSLSLFSPISLTLHLFSQFRYSLAFSLSLCLSLSPLFCHSHLFISVSFATSP